MKYESFKKKVASMLEKTNPGEAPIDFKNGTKLVELLEKDLLGTVKLCSQIS